MKEVFVEGSWYRTSVEIASKVLHLQRCIAAMEADKRYKAAEKCRQRIYDIMDKALFELEAYELNERGAA